MHGEISFDLEMNDSMEFVEGTFRLPGADWQVFIFGPDYSVTSPVVVANARWENGITGVGVKWPEVGWKLNKQVVIQIMSEALGVTEWKEVRGPDSMQLR